MSKKSWKLNCWINNKTLSSRIKRKKPTQLLDSFCVWPSKLLFFSCLFRNCLQAGALNRISLALNPQGMRLQQYRLAATVLYLSFFILPHKNCTSQSHPRPFCFPRKDINNPVLSWQCYSPSFDTVRSVLRQWGERATAGNCHQSINICLSKGQHLHN